MSKYTVGAQQGVYEVNRVSHIFENVGFTATLDCEMDGAVYASSDYIGWTKQMLPSDTANEAAAAVAEGDLTFVSTDELLVANFGEVRERFQQTTRYRVATPPPRTYSRATLRSVLTIRDLRPEDSGKYICYIRSSEIRKAQIKLLTVLSPVERVIISGPRDSLLVANVRRAGKPTLAYVAGQTSYVQCRTVGGNPRPEVRVYVGDRVVGASADSEATESVAGVTGGMQWRNYTVTRHVTGFVPSAEDDGKLLRCEGRVPHGVRVMTATEMITVYWLPLFQPEFCDTSQEAYLGDENIDLSCQFRSQPPFLSVTWRAMTSGQTLQSGEAEVGGMRAFLFLVKEAEGIFSATLRIRKVDVRALQKYKLTLTNSLGSVSTMIELKKPVLPI